MPSSLRTVLVGVPAALAFAGDVYTGLKARELGPVALDWAQGRLGILSGLYGLLRPLDVIQPYRLEMGVKLATPRGEDLYAFWRHTVTKAAEYGGPRPRRSGRGEPGQPGVLPRGWDCKALKPRVVVCHFKEAAPGWRHAE